MVPVPVRGSPAGGPLKVLLRAAIALLFAALVGLCTLRFDQRRVPAFTLALWHAAGPFRAGAARVEIELPEHPVLAGYAGHHRAREKAGPVYVRALAVEVGGGRRVTITAIDTLLIPPAFEHLAGCELIAATHTHTGPGGLWDNRIAGWLGAGEPDAAQKRAVEEARRQAVEKAARALRPAQMQIAHTDWIDGPARARSEGRIDPQITALRFRALDGGATIGSVVVYGMHPTRAPHDVLSADWPAEVDGEAPMLVLQGAVGNTTWQRDGSPGRLVRNEVDRLLAAAPAVREGVFDCAMTYPEVPQPEASVRVPRLFRRAVSNLLSLSFPGMATQTRVRIGTVELVGIPGEPVGELGLAARPTVLVGLSGGYLGYVETEEHWRRGTGESGKTYFGPDLARALGIGAR